MAIIMKYPFIFILLCAIGLTSLELIKLPVSWSPLTLLAVGISIHLTKLFLTAAGAASVVVWFREKKHHQRN